MSKYPEIEELLINPQELRSVNDIDETLLDDERQQVSLAEANLQPAALRNFTPELPLQPLKRLQERSLAGDFIMIQSLSGLINQNIKNVLFTRKGEKISDKSFGVGLQTFLFENNNNDVILKIKKEINSQFSKYLSYLTIVNLDVTRSTLNENRIDISLKYRAGNLQEETNFTARG